MYKFRCLKDNPYAIFLAGKLRRDLAAHPMVAVFHTNNYTQHEMINVSNFSM